MNTRSSEHLFFPVGRKKKLLLPNGQENNKLDSFQKHIFLKANNFFNFIFFNLNGKVLDLPSSPFYCCILVCIKVFCTGKF